MHTTFGTATTVTTTRAATSPRRIAVARRIGAAVALTLVLLAWAPSALAASVQPLATLRDDLAEGGVEALSVDATQGTVAVTPRLGKPYLVRYTDEAELAELIPLVARRQGAIELTWLAAESSDRTTLAELSAALEYGTAQVTVDPERGLLHLHADDGATTTLAFRSETAVSMLLAAQGAGVEMVRTTDPPPRPWWEWLLLGLTIAVLAGLLWVLLRRFHATSPGRAAVDDAERAAQE
jgi:hypothetical protein